MPGKVTKLVPFGAFVRVEEGIEGLVTSPSSPSVTSRSPTRWSRWATTPWSRSSTSTWSGAISLSLKQANEDYTEEFDPSKYGMADSYDEAGNYIFPEGFDAETNEWLEGFDKQRSEWEARYAEAERRHKMHTTQMEKFAAADAIAAWSAGWGYVVEFGSGGGRPGHWQATRSWQPFAKSWLATPSLVHSGIETTRRDLE